MKLPAYENVQLAEVGSSLAWAVHKTLTRVGSTFSDHSPMLAVYDNYLLTNVDCCLLRQAAY